MSAETRADNLFGIAAEFDAPEPLLAAATHVRDAGYTRVEAYTPFPIEGLSQTLGMPRTYVAPVVLAGAVVGGLTGYGMQWFANVIHYPWNVGGRPMNSWPMFMPITFELAILFAVVSGVVAMLAMNRLPQPYHPMFRLDAFDRASRDRFFLCVESSDPRFDLSTVRLMLESCGPLSIAEVPR